MSRPEFELAFTPDSVTLWTDVRLPFEPKGELLKARGALKCALRSLSVPANHILAARYSSPSRGFCDVENVLFYNVGTSAFALSTCNGLSFSRYEGTPSPSLSGITYAHEQHYYFVRTEQAIRPAIGCTIACDLPPMSSATKPHEVWWRVGAVAAAAPHQRLLGPFALQIDLQFPSLSNVANVLKPLLDGIISSLHKDSGLDSEAVRRLALKTGWNQEEIAKRLTAPAFPLLGERRLLHVYREFVKWNPADDLCTQCTIVARPGASWQCTFTVSEAGSQPD